MAPTQGRGQFREAAGRTSRIELPTPRVDGTLAIERALATRRSVREYRPGSLQLREVAQLLWAAQGITDAAGYRVTPSAGALYPLEMYLLAGDVAGLVAGVYHYDPRAHELTLVVDGDRRTALSRAALEQPCITRAALVLVMCAVYARTAAKYGERAVRYVHIEAGHAAQNVYLQAVALGLGTVAVGAFADERVRAVIGAPSDQQPLYLMPVGRL